MTIERTYTREYTRARTCVYICLHVRVSKSRLHRQRQLDNSTYAISIDRTQCHVPSGIPTVTCRIFLSFCNQSSRRRIGDYLMLHQYLHTIIANHYSNGSFSIVCCASHPLLPISTFLLYPTFCVSSQWHFMHDVVSLRLSRYRSPSYPTSPQID